jgi:geranylgeranyl pyrophosphate synthase
LLLLQHVNADRREELGAMIFGNNQQEQQHLLRLVLGNGVIGESLAAINTYISRAQTNLTALPSNAYTGTLAALTDYLSEQSRRLLKEAAA